jgi:hypothetical protein
MLQVLLRGHFALLRRVRWMRRAPCLGNIVSILWERAGRKYKLSASCLLNLSDAALDWPGVLECGILLVGVEVMLNGKEV